jgi:hypothetical protein
MKIRGKSNGFLRFVYYNERGDKVETQTDLSGEFILLNIDPTKNISVAVVSVDTKKNQINKVGAKMNQNLKLKSEIEKLWVFCALHSLKKKFKKSLRAQPPKTFDFRLNSQ